MLFFFRDIGQLPSDTCAYIHIIHISLGGVYASVNFSKVIGQHIEETGLIYITRTYSALHFWSLILVSYNVTIILITKVAKTGSVNIALRCFCTLRQYLDKRKRQVGCCGLLITFYCVICSYLDLIVAPHLWMMLWPAHLLVILGPAQLLMMVWPAHQLVIVWSAHLWVMLWPAHQLVLVCSLISGWCCGLLINL